MVVNGIGHIPGPEAKILVKQAVDVKFSIGPFRIGQVLVRLDNNRYLVLFSEVKCLVGKEQGLLRCTRGKYNPREFPVAAVKDKKQVALFGAGGQTGGSSPSWVVYFTDPGDPPGSASVEIENALVWLIDHAQQTIDIAVFEFNVQSVADALIRAHQRGVRVRVVYDNEHTEGDPQIDQLIAAGIPAVADERSALMHNKFFVFDADIVWTGSLNITENGIYRNNNNAIAIISQQLAANYTVEFEEMFIDHQFGPSSPANTPFPGTQVGDDTWVETYFSPDDQALQQLISLVNEAQQSVHFMSFSYTDYDLALAMMNRAAAGVEVAGLFETRGANTQYSECPTLLTYGLDVRLDSNPYTMHHKVIIIDGQTVAVGSFNYSTNATESNDENLLFIHNPVIAQLYEQEFYKLMGQANFPVGGECLAGN